jgi:hypothetical protein
MNLLEFDIADIWFVVTLSILLVILVSQAYLNWWLIARSQDLGEKAKSTEVLAEVVERHFNAKLTAVELKVERLEGALAGRLDASIKLLETIVTTNHKKE